MMEALVIHVLLADLSFPSRSLMDLSQSPYLSGGWRENTSSHEFSLGIPPKVGTFLVFFLAFGINSENMVDMPIL